MTAELNTFFPFDPYKLPRSGSYIQGVYREWSSVAIDDDEDEDDDDDEDEEEDEGADNAEHEDMASSQPVGILVNGVRAPSETSDDGLGQSFGGMSISPARAAHLQQVIVA